MKKEVFIHIGIGKTGTSSIQDMMFNNKKLFEQEGLYYPEVGLYNTAHHGLSQLSYEQDYLRLIAQNLKAIKEKFDSNRAYTKLLISSENLCFSTEKLISTYKDIFSSYNPKIIFYIRNQTKLVLSVYLEWVKNGWDYKGTLRDFFNFSKKEYDFEERLNFWEKYFSKTNIDIRIYDSLLFNDVSIDFLDAIEMIHMKDKIIYYRSNQSLSSVFCNAVINIDKFNISTEERLKIIQNLLSASSYLNIDCNEHILSKDLENQISVYYREKNLDFFEKYSTNFKQYGFSDNLFFKIFK